MQVRLTKRMPKARLRSAGVVTRFSASGGSVGSPFLAWPMSSNAFASSISSRKAMRGTERKAQATSSAMGSRGMVKRAALVRFVGRRANVVRIGEARGEDPALSRLGASRVQFDVRPLALLFEHSDVR